VYLGHLTPYTLHPTPYTLHHTPYTLYPPPSTLHPKPSTLDPTCRAERAAVRGGRLGQCVTGGPVESERLALVPATLLRITAGLTVIRANAYH